jgi:hypothetical protein
VVSISLAAIKSGLDATTVDCELLLGVSCENNDEEIKKLTHIIEPEKAVKLVFHFPFSILFYFEIINKFKFIALSITLPGRPTPSLPATAKFWQACEAL